MKPLRMKKSAVIAAAKKKPAGYLEDVLARSTEQEDGWLTISPENYERLSIMYANPGVGTELKALLRMIGFRSTVGCKCNQRAEEMNRQGIEWCKENVETIVGWLEEEAQKRKIPFFRRPARALVWTAIKRAESRKARNDD